MSPWRQTNEQQSKNRASQQIDKGQLDCRLSQSEIWQQLTHPMNVTILPLDSQNTRLPVSLDILDPFVMSLLLRRCFKATPPTFHHNESVEPVRGISSQFSLSRSLGARWDPNPNHILIHVCKRDAQICASQICGINFVTNQQTNGQRDYRSRIQPSIQGTFKIY